jgi:hypothetical protein
MFYVRPINCRYLVTTSCRSCSSISFLAPLDDFGRDDVAFFEGAGNVGGACTG